MAAEEAKKRFHFFINYRVRTEANLAEKFSDKLELQAVPREIQLRVKCFLDRKNLELGQNYEEDFLSGLGSSCVFLPLISENCLEPLTRLAEGGKDNVLLEYETALALMKEKKINILPILLGTVGSSGYKKFSGFTLNFPDHPSHTNPSGTIKKTMQELFTIQGLFVNPEEVAEKVPFIMETFGMIWPKYRDIWHDPSQIGPEKIFTCVQCQQQFKLSNNPEGSCIFHTGEVMQSRSGLCCDGGVGCGRGVHRFSHHQDYPYENLAKWAYDLLNWRGAEHWLEVESFDYENDYPVRAILGFISVGPEKGKIFVELGQVKDFFMLFTIADLQNCVDSQQLQFAPKRSKLPGKTSFEWVVEQNKVVGAILTAQSTSSQTPSSSMIRFQMARDEQTEEVTATMGEIKVLSLSGILEKKPNAEYTIPEGLYLLGPLNQDMEFRKPQLEFPTTGNLPVRIKVTEIRQEGEWANLSTEIFSVTMSIINLETTRINFLSTAVQWILRGAPDAHWNSLEEVTTTPNLPFGIEANEAIQLNLVVKLRDPERGKASWGANHISFIARSHPIVFAFQFEDVKGRLGASMTEFVNSQNHLNPTESPDVTTLFCDDTEHCKRSVLTIREELERETLKIIVRYPGYQFPFDEKDFRRAVYLARKNGNSTIQEIPVSQSLEMEIKIFALIDHGCSYVYALRIELATKTSRALGFYKIPLYGFKDEEHPIKNSEHAIIPSEFKLWKKVLPQPFSTAPVESPFQPPPTTPQAGSASVPSFNFVAFEDQIKKLLEAQIGHFEAKMEATINARLEAIETRVATLAKAAAEAPQKQPSSSASPSVISSSSGVLVSNASTAAGGDPANARLDQIAEQLNQLTQILEKKSKSSLPWKKN